MYKVLKIIVIFVSIFILCGCEDSHRLLEDKIKKNCKEYTIDEIVSYGGGEFENRGIIYYGKCDNDEYVSYSDEKISGNTYNFKKVEFIENTDYIYSINTENNSKKIINMVTLSDINELIDKKIIQNFIKDNNLDYLHLYQVNEYNNILKIYMGTNISNLFPKIEYSKSLKYSKYEYNVTNNKSRISLDDYLKEKIYIEEK